MVLDTVATETFARSATVRMSIKLLFEPVFRLDLGMAYPIDEDAFSG
jgi:hypothetical protein